SSAAQDAVEHIVAGKQSATTHQPDKRQRFDALAHALKLFAQRRPLILVVEDLHWADLASLELLQHIAAGVGREQIELIATYRPEELGDGDPLRAALAKLRRNKFAWHIALDPLDPTDMRVLIRHAAEQDSHLDAGTLEAVVKRAEGNPLFAEELLKSAFERQSKAGARPALPPSIEHAVIERLGSFDAADRAILASAAAVGRRFKADFLALFCEQPVERVLDVLKRAVKAQLVVEGTDLTYAFRHALSRDAVYSELLEVEARPLHSRIAQALSQSPDSPERTVELAYHWWQAAELGKAAAYCEIAGDQSLSACAFSDAAQLYERAIKGQESTGGPVVAALREKLAESLYRAGMGKRALEAYRAAQEDWVKTGDPERLAAVCAATALAAWNMGDGRTAFDECERALEHVDSASPIYFRAHTNLARFFISTRSRRAADHLAAAEKYTGPRPVLDDLRFHESHALICTSLGDVGGAVAHFQRALELAAKTGDQANIVRYSGNFGITMAELGEYEHSMAAFEVGARIIEARGLVGSEAAAFHRQFAAACVDFGEFGKARQLIERSLATAVDIHRFQLLTAQVAISIGIRHEDQELIDTCASPDLVEMAFLPGNESVMFVAMTFAELHLAQGDIPRARALMHKVVDGYATDPDAVDEIGMFLTVAEHGDADDIPRAREFITRSPAAKRGPPMNAHLLLFDALAARRNNDRQTAEAKAREAATSYRQLHWRWHEAKALEAGGLEKQALDLYREIGDNRAANRLEAVLNPVNKRGRAKSELTEREQEISKLIGMAKSNRAIAQELNISERTVETHVSSILAKLHVTTRTQLVAHLKS
ncbi:MAG TPA: LuxR C-terminal-related transcriptional regulator, partial [Steroidobacteraceae bacterium]|nr:LuxR C-terminal-related transcriptional regulator [Steroidobacteraceae bacterium]